MSKIETQVMAGVASVYVARKLLSRTALECYALFLSAFSITILVSLPNVVANFSAVAGGGLPNMFGYTLAAIVGTKFIVQLALLIGTTALALMAIDAIRALRAPAYRLA